jgi:uncharacterized membrane protein YeaQ/YmgE (transglycosylase-associated protein family)
LRGAALAGRIPQRALGRGFALLIVAGLSGALRGVDGQGPLDTNVPAAWHLSMIMALMHAASGELGAGRVDDAVAGPALVATIVGALTTRRAIP